MAQSLPVFPIFDIEDTSSLGPRWDKYIIRLENLLVAMNVTSINRKNALLLHYIGPECHDIYTTLELPEGEDDLYTKSKTALTNYFKPKVNVEYEKYIFRNCKQNQNEALDSFCTRLRQLSLNCGFVDKEAEIKSQIIQGCLSTKLRTTALKKPEWSLQDMIDHAKAMELVKSHAEGMVSGNPEMVNKLNSQFKKKNDSSFKANKSDTKNYSNVRCFNCGGKYPHSTTCPAQGVECNYCKKPNHFMKFCKARQRANSKQKPRTKQTVHAVEQRDSDEDYVFTVTDSRIKTPHVAIKINGTTINMLADSGSSVNIIDEQTKCKIKDVMMTRTSTPLFAYGSKTPLPVAGKFTAVVESKDKFLNVDFIVTKGSSGCLLSFDTACKLGILNIVNTVAVEKHQSLFTGLGKLKGNQVKLHINSNIKPISQPHRRIPFHIRKKVDVILKKLGYVWTCVRPTRPYHGNVISCPRWMTSSTT